MSRGKKPSWIACWVNEYAPEMIAWEAMTVAALDKITSGMVNERWRHLEKQVLCSL